MCWGFVLDCLRGANYNALTLFLLLGILGVFGFLLELSFSRLHFALTKTHYKEHHFTFGKYLYLLLTPTVLVFVLTVHLDLNLAAIFVSFAIFGTIAEWFLGFFYHKIVGQRLWTYHKYHIMHYTSFLSILLWGFAGIIFWFLLQIFY